MIVLATVSLKETGDYLEILTLRPAWGTTPCAFSNSAYLDVFVASPSLTPVIVAVCTILKASFGKEKFFS